MTLTSTIISPAPSPFSSSLPGSTVPIAISGFTIFTMLPRLFNSGFSITISIISISVSVISSVVSSLIFPVSTIVPIITTFFTSVIRSGSITSVGRILKTYRN